MSDTERPLTWGWEGQADFYRRLFDRDFGEGASVKLDALAVRLRRMSPDGTHPHLTKDDSVAEWDLVDGKVNPRTYRAILMNLHYGLRVDDPWKGTNRALRSFRGTPIPACDLCATCGGTRDYWDNVGPYCRCLGGRMTYIWRMRFHVLHGLGLTTCPEEGGSIRPGRKGSRWCTPYGWWKCGDAWIRRLPEARRGAWPQGFRAAYALHLKYRPRLWQSIRKVLTDPKFPRGGYF